MGSYRTQDWGWETQVPWLSHQPRGSSLWNLLSPLEGFYLLEVGLSSWTFHPLGIPSGVCGAVLLTESLLPLGEPLLLNYLSPSAKGRCPLGSRLACCFAPSSHILGAESVMHPEVASVSLQLCYDYKTVVSQTTYVFSMLVSFPTSSLCSWF
jgi:hypothetical protein